MTTISQAQQQQLRQHHLFRSLSDEQFAQLLHDITLRSLPAGQRLFDEGEEAHDFYLLLSGQVKLYRLSAAGQEKVMEIIRPGQSFAEALMFLELPAYPVSAQSLTDIEYAVVRNAGFLQLLSQSTETCFHLLADISMRLHGLLNEIDALTLQNASLRVVNYLRDLAREAGEGDGSAALTLPAAKNIIASRLSIQPETLSRILGNLAGRGLIRVDGLNIHVLDLEGLRSLEAH